MIAQEGHLHIYLLVLYWLIIAVRKGGEISLMLAMVRIK